MNYEDLLPFYERSIPYLPKNSFVTKILGSCLIGGIVLALHFWRIKFVVFENFGWLLSVIITVALLALFYATHTFFRLLLPQLSARLNENDLADFKRIIPENLSDKQFVMYGLVFGLANCAMGLMFGLPKIYDDSVNTAILLFAFFTAGFVCGLPLLGIIGVTRCLSKLDEYKSMDGFFDYTSPDGCGGTQFLGGALVVFSSVTMIVGVLISVYILKTAWSQNGIWILVCYWGWILLPYLMGLFVLIVPAIAIHSALCKYKLKKEQDFAKELMTIRNKLEQGNLTAEERKTLSDEYEFKTKLRNQLHGMRTWPFSTSANLAYFASVATSAGISVNSLNLSNISSEILKLIHHY